MWLSKEDKRFERGFLSKSIIIFLSFYFKSKVSHMLFARSAVVGDIFSKFYFEENFLQNCIVSKKMIEKLESYNSADVLKNFF